MRRLLLFGGLFLLLIIGGGLTAQLIATDGGSLLPILTQTVNPDASPTVLLPWKAEQFFLLVGFVLFNLVGIALTIAVIIWFIDRSIRHSKRTVSSTSGSSE